MSLDPIAVHRKFNRANVLRMIPSMRGYETLQAHCTKLATTRDGPTLICDVRQIGGKSTGSCPIKYAHESYEINANSNQGKWGNYYYSCDSYGYNVCDQLPYKIDTSGRCVVRDRSLRFSS